MSQEYQWVVSNKYIRSMCVASNDDCNHWVPHLVHKTKFNSPNKNLDPKEQGHGHNLEGILLMNILMS